MIANLLNYIVWDPDPILAHLGPMTIRYYSTCWMIGLLLGYLLMSKLYKQQGLSDEKFSPLFLYIFFGVLIGGRLGHCIFYQPEYFLTQWDHFIEMLIPVHHMPDGSWKFTGYEGLASHGGVHTPPSIGACARVGRQDIIHNMINVNSLFILLKLLLS